MPQTPVPPEPADGFDHTDPLKPLNAEAISPRAGQVAVALRDRTKEALLPEIVASGRGAVAARILDLAFANGIKVREDADLAQLLAQYEIDSPVPTEALMAVGEILAYVYEANGAPNPFDFDMANMATPDDTSRDP